MKTLFRIQLIKRHTGMCKKGYTGVHRSTHRGACRGTHRDNQNINIPQFVTFPMSFASAIRIWFEDDASPSRLSTHRRVTTTKETTRDSLAILMRQWQPETELHTCHIHYFTLKFFTCVHIGRQRCRLGPLNFDTNPLPLAAKLVVWMVNWHQCIATGGNGNERCE